MSREHDAIQTLLDQARGLLDQHLPAAAQPLLQAAYTLMLDERAEPQRAAWRRQKAAQRELALGPGGEGGGAGGGGTSLVRASDAAPTVAEPESHSVASISQHPAVQRTLGAVAATARQQHLVERRRVQFAELVFSYWQTVLVHPHARLDRQREGKLVARLKENGDNVSELLYVIDGAQKDDWLMGRDPRASRKYDNITTLFRDREQVERLAGRIPGYHRNEPHPMLADLFAAASGEPLRPTPPVSPELPLPTTEAWA